MPLASTISFVASAAGSPLLAALAIIGGTFVHEDIATVATGILVADGILSPGLALPALYAGIVLGDAGLYFFGRLIALHRVSQRFANHERFAALKVWLDTRLVAGVFVVRFLPGLRLPAYTTYGFFAMPFKRFALSVVLAASIWTTGLFYLSYLFGAATEHWLGFYRWPVLIIAVMVPFFFIERIIRGKIPGGTKSDANAGK